MKLLYDEVFYNTRFLMGEETGKAVQDEIRMAIFIATFNIIGSSGITAICYYISEQSYEQS